jgi:antitoxin component YwqK of YwqJK toxin-antitoxin module
MNKKELIKHGLYEYYYEDKYSDQIKWRGNYKDGIKHGLVEAFHWKNGYLLRKEYWRDGKEEGFWEQYDQETGKLTNSANFVKGNQVSAEWFFENGQVEIRGKFKNNEQHGLWEYFDEDGRLSYKGHFKKGKENGLWQGFHENGVLLYSGNMLNGESEGLFEWFHENGQLQRRGKHKQGELMGLWEYFDTDGQLIETKVFENGVEIIKNK